MRFLLSLILLFISLSLFSQYALGKRTIVFYDNVRSNRAVTTELYYPASAAGIGTPLVPGSEKFPVVVFGHGFVMPTTAYTWLADSLVKYGYIVAFPSTETGISPNHNNFGKDIAFLCSRISSLNDSVSSFLFGRVLPKSAAAGHSMGGGSSFLAMAANTTITALFNFAAAETNPSAKTAAFSIQRPSLIFSGNNDCIVAPAQQLEMYNNIPYLCKTYINIQNALHCQFGNNDPTCVFGQISSGCNSSAITPALVFEKVCYLLIPFLNYYLKSDCTAGILYQSNYNSITAVTKARVCTSDSSGCVVTGINDPFLHSSVRIFPNPVSDGWLHLGSLSEKLLSVEILDINGRILLKREKINNCELILFLSQKGIFIARIRTLSGQINRKLLVQ